MKRGEELKYARALINVIIAHARRARASMLRITFASYEQKMNTIKLAKKQKGTRESEKCRNK